MQPIWARVDLGVMAEKGNTSFLRLLDEFRFIRLALLGKLFSLHILSSADKIISPKLCKIREPKCCAYLCVEKETENVRWLCINKIYSPARGCLYDVYKHIFDHVHPFRSDIVMAFLVINRKHQPPQSIVNSSHHRLMTCIDVYEETSFTINQLHKVKWSPIV